LVPDVRRTHLAVPVEGASIATAWIENSIHALGYRPVPFVRPCDPFMASQTADASALAVHGAAHLPSVEVDSYNVEIRDDEGFVGDRITTSTFRNFIDDLRKLLRKDGEDPLGNEPTEDLGKKTLDKLLAGEPEAAGIVQGAIEDFARELARVIRRFLKLKAWQRTERIAVGGGFRASRVGELVVARAGVILKSDGVDIALTAIRNDPDAAGLIGAAHLVPSWVFRGHEGIVAVDVGGNSFRAGIIDLNLKRTSDLSKASIWKSDQWRHAGDKPSRDEAVEGLLKMLRKLIARAEDEGLRLAPFIGIGCPGHIKPNGAIDRGAQNLPGNWESDSFNLPSRLCQSIPKIGGHETMVLMHNDAVVQGLSEVPFMQDVRRWGILTIGTGLGNARFTNHSQADD
jgi:predicted NBD/HSP70 family sugar kinase